VTGLRGARAGERALLGGPESRFPDGSGLRSDGDRARLREPRQFSFSLVRVGLRAAEGAVTWRRLWMRSCGARPVSAKRTRRPGNEREPIARALFVSPTLFCRGTTGRNAKACARLICPGSGRVPSRPGGIPARWQVSADAGRPPMSRENRGGQCCLVGRGIESGLSMVGSSVILPSGARHGVLGKVRCRSCENACVGSGA
jgi:hypothetical protein